MSAGDNQPVDLRRERADAGWVTADSDWPAYSLAGVPTCTQCRTRMTYLGSQGGDVEGRRQERVTWWCAHCDLTVTSTLKWAVLGSEQG